MKKKVRYSFLMLYAVFGHLSVNPQTVGHQIVGVVVDSVTRVPLTTTTIRLKENGNLIMTVVSDSSGIFRFIKIKSGLYKVEVSSVSYESKEFNLPLTDSLLVHSLDTLFLKSESKVLKGITVIADKSLIEDLGD
ncbi:MAG TPA: carboxypeptidase regulatory-like domain-containing protein, partial [Candidatus Dojkabacteria bacterium]|nr:carboxypeptidase regulatory-like domain-containing protein [Candidatus Dojkabacteria bacterium]